MSAPAIENVSDTALWVATYRAMESERPDALFHDRLAARLAGDRGRTIARRMKGSRYTSWSVVVRTCIIDAFVRELVAAGVDTVLNLGAGLDTRPYRLDLPTTLRWIEVDYPRIIELKEERLRDEQPRCKLQRIALDLTDREKRTRVFADISKDARNVLVLTEGVIPYLSAEQVGELAFDLRSHETFRFWILDYFAPKLARFMQRARMRRQMQNAPLRFLPDDWFGFFRDHGWKARQTRYHVEESAKLGRPLPTPWWGRLMGLVLSPQKRAVWGHAAGYALLEPT